MNSFQVKHALIMTVRITRYNAYQTWLHTIQTSEQGFDKFSRGYLSYGFQIKANGDITYKEWAPGAETAALVGDFSK